MPFDLQEKFIVAAELELGGRLPESYRKAMMRNNGGEISTEEDDWQLYPIADNSDKKRMSRTCNHIIRETNSAKSWHNFPTNVVAIGHNGCGDHLVFTLNNGKYGPEVFFWSHETGELYLFANDYEELSRL